MSSSTRRTSAVELRQRPTVQSIPLAAYPPPNVQCMSSGNHHLLSQVQLCQEQLGHVFVVACLLQGDAPLDVSFEWRWRFRRIGVWSLECSTSRILFLVLFWSGGALLELMKLFRSTFWASPNFVPTASQANRVRTPGRRGNTIPTSTCAVVCRVFRVIIQVDYWPYWLESGGLTCLFMLRLDTKCSGGFEAAKGRRKAKLSGHHNTSMMLVWSKL